MERARAILWERGRAKDLGTLGGEFSLATSINESGVVAGASVPRGSDEDWRACLWENGRVRDLGKPGGSEWAVAMAINRSGEVVGASGSGCSEARAVVWRAGKPYDLNRLLSGGRGWFLFQATGINDRGQITGAGLKGGKLHAFLLNPRRASELTNEPAETVEPLRLERNLPAPAVSPLKTAPFMQRGHAWLCGRDHAWPVDPTDFTYLTYRR
jgi:hypothetical protein